MTQPTGASAMQDIQTEHPGDPVAGPAAGPVLEHATFNRIAALAHREAGLAIPPGKAAMVRTRLARRLRLLNLSDFDTYFQLVSSPEGLEERRELVSALTTNVSHFFREVHHFHLLKETILPPLMDRLRAGGRVRIWSAGCSNGQEPYSIAMCIRAMGNLPPRADLRILASDIDPKVVAFARAGLYPVEMMTGLTPEQRDTYFTRRDEGGREAWQIDRTLRDLIAFRELNLLQNWPMRGGFDLIFCRNVVIYFDAGTQDQLWPRFVQALSPDGWLLLGHSERVSNQCLQQLTNRGITAYQNRTDSDLPRSAGQDGQT